jgi:hypothetical protein
MVLPGESTQGWAETRAAAATDGLKIEDLAASPDEQPDTKALQADPCEEMCMVVLCLVDCG